MGSSAPTASRSSTRKPGRVGREKITSGPDFLIKTDAPLRFSAMPSSKPAVRNAGKTAVTAGAGVRKRRRRDDIKFMYRFASHNATAKVKNRPSSATCSKKMQRICVESSCAEQRRASRKKADRMLARAETYDNILKMFTINMDSKSQPAASSPAAGNHANASHIGRRIPPLRLHK